ncbi:MAG: hypothetical protein E4H27_00465 [Anaerolineales bacterium]|nr:MAG: hypothetical protein E4H27_00465 [Anaerolineales bacterium]
MQHPIIVLANAKVHYDRLAREANQHRQLTRLSKKPSLLTRIFVWVTGMSKPLNNEAVLSTTRKTTA